MGVSPLPLSNAPATRRRGRAARAATARACSSRAGEGGSAVHGWRFKEPFLYMRVATAHSTSPLHLSLPSHHALGVRDALPERAQLCDAAFVGGKVEQRPAAVVRGEGRERWAVIAQHSVAMCRSLDLRDGPRRRHLVSPPTPHLTWPRSGMTPAVAILLYVRSAASKLRVRAATEKRANLGGRFVDGGAEDR